MHVLNISTACTKSLKGSFHILCLPFPGYISARTLNPDNGSVTCSSSFLVVVVNAFGQAVVDDKAHIPLVDAHAKGNCGHNDVDMSCTDQQNHNSVI